jgi:hypothetical protein
MIGEHQGRDSAKGEGKVFFFEKKNQKTFATWARSCLHLRDQLAKVFCFFSSEKKTLLFSDARMIAPYLLRTTGRRVAATARSVCTYRR